MIEKQSDNVENLEENVSEEVNKNEDSSVIENQTSEDKESLNVDDENIYAEDLKNCEWDNREGTPCLTISKTPNTSSFSSLIVGVTILFLSFFMSFLIFRN